MKYSRERFQMDHYARGVPQDRFDVWEFRFAITQSRLPIETMTLSTVEYQTETAARARCSSVLKINGTRLISHNGATFELSLISSSPTKTPERDPSEAPGKSSMRRSSVLRSDTYL